MNTNTVFTKNAYSLPFWRRPIALLALMVFGMHMGFATWMALLNNFVHERANFDGSDLGWLQSVREIPGFFAVAVIVVLWVMREQILAIVSLIMLGFAVAVTAWFPTFGGLLITTFISSLGFHYYETVKQSLELQWIPKDKAPQTLGWLLAVGSAGSLIAYGGVAILWKYFEWDYNKLYLISGSITILIALFCYFAYPSFKGPTIQNSTLILRKRYWLFYALQFMAGARRQIFIVFAAFMIFSGVLKSGCPALKLITSCPAYLSSAARDVISRVKEGLTLLTLSANFISEWSVVFYDIQKNYN